MQKSNSNNIVRKEVKSTIKNVLDIAENITTDEDTFTKFATTIEVENTTENLVQFQNAINEISDASYEACYGSNNSLVLPEDTPVLIRKFEKAVNDSKSTEARHIFGRLLCLKQKFQTNITLVVKRQAVVADEYEKTLNEWFENLSVTDIPVLFHYEVNEDTGVSEQTLAFVIDDTGSMRKEIDAVKELIKAIIKAEKDSPFFYILGTFNDPGTGNIYWLALLNYSAALMQCRTHTTLFLNSTGLLE